jgi:hypothetical protein
MPYGTVKKGKYTMHRESLLNTISSTDVGPIQWKEVIDSVLTQYKEWFVSAEKIFYAAAQQCLTHVSNDSRRKFAKREFLDYQSATNGANRRYAPVGWMISYLTLLLKGELLKPNQRRRSNDQTPRTRGRRERPPHLPPRRHCTPRIA